MQVFESGINVGNGMTQVARQWGKTFLNDFPVGMFHESRIPQRV
jgi:hypothetical protein